MATTPDGHRRFGLNAIERNIARGIETKKVALRLLCDGSKDARQVEADIRQSIRQIRRLLKALEEVGYLRRERKSSGGPYVHAITEDDRGHAQKK